MQLALVRSAHPVKVGASETELAEAETLAQLMIAAEAMRSLLALMAELQ